MVFRFAILFLLIFNLYAIENETFQNYINKSNELKEELKHLIERKKLDTLAIAMGISRSSDIAKALKQNNSDLVDFKRISKDFKHGTSLKNVWFQLITNDGKSLQRSWTDKKGDFLTFRFDIPSLLKYPKLTQYISVGKYDMTFKTIVPIYDKKDTLLGFLETITHFNSIDRALQKQDIKSVILVDKTYSDKITIPFTKKYVNDHYIANKDAPEALMNMLKEKNLEDFISKIKKEGHYLDKKNKMMVSYYALPDIENKPMGHFFLFYPMDKLNIRSTIKLTDEEKEWVKKLGSYRSRAMEAYELFNPGKRD